MLLTGACRQQVAGYNESARDADMRGQRCPDGVYCRDDSDDAERCAHGTFGVVFVCPRIAEIHQHAVTDKSRNVAVIACNFVDDGALVFADHIAQILGVESIRQSRRSN